MSKKTGQNFGEYLVENYERFESYDGKDKVVSMREMADIVRTQHKPQVIKSGVPSFDNLVNGFVSGELIAVSGPRKAGKTLWAQTLTDRFSKDGVKSLWFSYEVTPGQLIERFPELPEHTYTPSAMEAYSLDWLKERVMEGMVKEGISVVFIDHLHYLLDLARVGNVSIELGQVIRFIKRMANELNLIIFVMCHMKKLDPYTEPSDMDVRDSSFVSQESDMGVVIWRDVESEDQAWLKICYDRRSGVLEKKIRMVKVNGLLQECTDVGITT
jgi:predicted ATP-dependent serine protease